MPSCKFTRKTCCTKPCSHPLPPTLIYSHPLPLTPIYSHPLPHTPTHLQPTPIYFHSFLTHTHSISTHYHPLPLMFSPLLLLLSPLPPMCSLSHPFPAHIQIRPPNPTYHPPFQLIFSPCVLRPYVLYVPVSLCMCLRVSRSHVSM